MGNYSQAEPLYQRALAIYEKMLGKEHPSVAQSLNNLAELTGISGITAKPNLYSNAPGNLREGAGQEHPMLPPVSTIWQVVLGKR
jgi:hypothetical protein